MPHPDPDPRAVPQAFVPVEQIRRKKPRADAWAPGELGAIDARLAQFQAQLSPEEREAFTSLLGSGNPALAALGALEPEQILEPDELAVFHALTAAPRPARRTLPSQVVLIMKATLLCNLRCTYCSSWSDKPNAVMSFRVLAHAVHGVLSAPGVRGANFVWHGGETTLRPISFYLKALWLQERFRGPGQTVTNAIQTNGTHLTDDWLEFLKRYDFSAGISLDGPPEIHDSRRVDTAGKPTSERVRAGLRRLQEHGVKHGVLMVVDEDIVSLGAERMLEYLLSLGVRSVSLLNVAPEGDPALASPDEPYLEYGRFVEYLRDLFAIWHPAYADRITIREISDLVARLEGTGGGFCVYGPNCVGRFFTVEPGGEVSHCDKYQQNPAFRFGNVVDTPLADIPAAPALQRAHGYTAAGLDLTRGCEWWGVCHGGCPYDRYVRVVRRGAEHDERCCGLGPLLSDMAQALGVGTSSGSEPIAQAAAPA
jgi:uncharacterized protein